MSQYPQLNLADGKAVQATIKTNQGDIKLQLFPDQAPKTVKNFVELAKQGYYKGVIFHRVIPDFMIQGGDPLGTGTGGPGYTFNDEIHPELQFDRPYLLAMANAGVRRNPVTGEAEGTNGSQFFISTVPTPWLNGKHTIFGEVADDESRAVVDAINATPTRPGDRPQEDIVITSVTIED